MEGLNSGALLDIVLIIFGAYYLVCGLAGLFTGKIYAGGKKLAETYTEDSLEKYTQPYNAATLLLGAGIALFEVRNLARDMNWTGLQGLQSTFLWVVLCVMAVAAIVILLVSKKLLVKKENVK